MKVLASGRRKGRVFQAEGSEARRTERVCVLVLLGNIW